MRSRTEQILLCTVYTLTCLEDRAWSFGISLCMQLLGGMQLVSIEQMMEGLAQMAFSGTVGRAVDRRDERKFGMVVCLMGNNLSIILSTIFFAICLSIPPSSIYYTISIVIGIIFCSCYRVFVTAEKSMLARDWMMVLLKEDESFVARTIALLTSLDQATNIVSPLLLGGLLSFVTLRTTCFVLSGCSLASLVVKSTLLTTLLSTNDNLSIRRGHEPTTTSDTTSSLFASVSLYYSQSTFTAALAMALLFMTVLGFDGLAVGYGESIGVPENILGLFRSFSAATGVFGALAYALFERRIGVRKTGLLGLTWEWLFLMLAVASIWMPGSPFDPSDYFSTLSLCSWWQSFVSSFVPDPSAPPPTSPPRDIDWKAFTTSDGTSLISIFAFLTSISVARFGLWMADLAITHIMQVHSQQNQRNTVFGVHNAVCQTFSVLKDLLVIILPSPETFGICILISYGFTSSALIFYIYSLVKMRQQEGMEWTKL